jgi:diguanylate cyclase (GGDEF)-like protein
VFVDGAGGAVATVADEDEGGASATGFSAAGGADATGGVEAIGSAPGEVGPCGLVVCVVHDASTATRSEKIAGRARRRWEDIVADDRTIARRAVARFPNAASHIAPRKPCRFVVKFGMSSNIHPPYRDSMSSSPRITPVSSPTRVLVVDDDRDVREALAEILDSNGYEAVTAKDGDEALVLLDRDESIELVLLDMNLPELDGFDILRRLKGRDRRREVPVICLSARTAVEDKVAGLKLGAADYLAKPFDVQELFARMARPLRVKHVLERLDRAKSRAEQLSLTDPLTGLPNRRDLERRLAKELDRAERANEPLGCLMLDIDRFKEVNDRFGHFAGDAVLVDVARALEASLRSFDVVARYGGDEFVALLPGATLDAARHVAEALCDVVSTLAISIGTAHVLRLSISVGAVSGNPDSLEDAKALLARADAALLEAKRTGRNRVVSAP